MDNKEKFENVTSLVTYLSFLMCNNKGDLNDDKP